MGSLTPLKIPIIDFSKEELKPGTSYWDSLRDKVQHALEEYGCFEAAYDKVPLDLHKAFFDASEELFDLPTATKMQNTSETPYFGYIGQLPYAPLYESLGIDNAPVLEGTQSFTNQMWPNGNSSFCETVNSFSKRVSELDQMVTRMVFESYGVEKYFDSLIGSITYLLRVMKYGAPQTDENELVAYAHTDKSFITILHQNQVNGLEVQTKDGEWISVTPSPSSFVVMVGDGLLGWSNGRLHAPHHRVMMSGNDARYSTGLFSFSNGVIQAPEELVDEEHPALFKPFEQKGLMRFYFTEEGQKAESTIKAYCGL